MAAHAGKAPAVARLTSELVETHFAAGVFVDEVAGMVCGLELEIAGVALLATEGIVDLVVANETIRHTRQMELRIRLLGLSEPAVAPRTGVPGDQASANVTHVSEILAAVDCLGDALGCIAQRQVLPVVEPEDALGGRPVGEGRGVNYWSGLSVVAGGAQLLLGKVMVRGGSAALGRGMAERAIEPDLAQMELMGELDLGSSEGRG